MTLGVDFLPSVQMDQFTYELPNEQIATFPIEPKDHSRLLIYRNEEIEHKCFYDLPSALDSETLLVFNDTKVIPARLLFQSSSQKPIEIFLLKQRPGSPEIWECLVGNRKAFKENEHLILTHSELNQIQLTASWFSRDENLLKLAVSPDMEIIEAIELFGNVPLPPYIKRKPTARDKEYYQTIFAKIPGAVAAPTASLHFTPSVFQNLGKKGIDHSFITLHVGLGTFKPVTAKDTTEHEMHSERYQVSQGFLEKLKNNLEKNIVPVGTTSMRVLESLHFAGARLLMNVANPFQISRDDGFNPNYKRFQLPETLDALIAFSKEYQTDIIGETSIFILPGFQFQLSNALVTNFHQPNSTLLLLVAAFIGDDWRNVYNAALDADYRMLSYGDASLLFRHSEKK